MRLTKAWWLCIAALLVPTPSCSSGADGSSCTVMETASGARIVCEDGTTADISDGSNGMAGMDGMDGMDGADGLSSLVAVTTEAAGENCPAGGLRIDHGVDDDADGTLDAEEIDGTEYSCDGVDGIDGDSALVSVTVEAPGTNCAAGGQRIDTGIDVDADDTLDAEEIDSTSYVCNGTDGLDSLVDIDAEPRGANCAFGGQRIRTGRDTDGSGTLDDAEVTDTAYICNETSWSLYLSRDNEANGLYRIDPTTGAATRSGTGTTGVNSSTVGLAYDANANVLYGSRFSGLNRIQVDGSGATNVGSVAAEALGYDSATRTLYGAINGSFFRINTADGTNAGALAAPGVDVEGLAVRSSTGTVFGISATDDNLRAYDIATNTWSVVGLMGIGSTGTHYGYGLAYDHRNDVLYATGGAAEANLFRIDPATGAATLVGSTGLASADGGLAFARDP